MERGRVGGGGLGGGGLWAKPTVVHVIIHRAEEAAYSLSIKGTVEREDKMAETPLFFTIWTTYLTHEVDGGGLILRSSSSDTYTTKYDLILLLSPFLFLFLFCCRFLGCGAWGGNVNVKETHLILTIGYFVSGV